MKTTFSTVLAAVKLILADLAQLATPTVATAAAGVIAPIALGLFGLNFSPAVIGGWLTLVGSLAAMIEKIASGQAAAAVRASK